jgi:hypothetical protein
MLWPLAEYLDRGAVAPRTKFAANGGGAVESGPIAYGFIEEWRIRS